MTNARIKSGGLSASVSPRGSHGWCGLDRLAHADDTADWLVRPAITLEHYLGVPLDAPEYIEYEPFASQRSLRKVRKNGCSLHYGPQDCSQVTCTIDYQVVEPHYVDTTVEVLTERDRWPHGYLGLFFATIVEAPAYSGVTFRGFDSSLELGRHNPWIYFNGYGGKPGLTVHPSGVSRPELGRPTDPPDVYYYSDSSIRFVEPFFFGRVNDMVFGVLFRGCDRERVRFTVNPLSGFGSPAWDFFWIIEDPEPDQMYTLPFRVLFKPFVSGEDILTEFRAYASTSHGVAQTG